MSKSVKFSQIKGLGQVKVDRIEAAMVKGISNPKIAEMIQDGWDDLLELKRTTLTKQLLRYKKDVIDGHLYKQVTKKVTSIVKGDDTKEVVEVTTERVFKKYDNKIDSLLSLQELVNLQTARLQKQMNLEALNPSLLLKETKFEIRELSSLIKQLTDLEFDMGIVHRQPKKLIGSITLGSSATQEQHAMLEQELKNNDQTLAATHAVFDLLDDITEGEYTEVIND